MDYDFEENPHLLLEQLRAECVTRALETMTRRIEQRLSAYLKRLKEQGLELGAQEWQTFLAKLPRSDKWFMRGYFHEIDERILRMIQGQPLAREIQKRGGKWPRKFLLRNHKSMKARKR